MNVKQGWGQAVVAALVVAVVTVGVNKLTDSSDEKATAAAIATLTANVGNLTKQVEKLNEQPYATRTELSGIENRISGLESRVREVERGQQSRR